MITTSNLYNYFLILFISFLLPILGFSNHISGVISDKNGEPLPFASIYIKNTTYGVSSNAFGEYFIELEPGNHTIIYSYIGFRNEEKSINLTEKPKIINVILFENDQDLIEYEVVSNTKNKALEILEKVKKTKKNYVEKDFSCKEYSKNTIEKRQFKLQRKDTIELWQLDTSKSINFKNDVLKFVESYGDLYKINGFNYWSYDGYHDFADTKKEQDFLIQDIDHAFLNGYIEWFESPSNNTKAKSLNTAYSYLMDLQIVLNWATLINVLDESHNPFVGKNGFKIPKRTRRAKEYTLNESQLQLILKAEPNSPDEQKAKDLFLLCFLMSGLRIMDVILLRKEQIKETLGEKYFDIMPMKTFRYGKRAEIKITSLIQKILDKYPGDGIFVLDCITANKEWNRKEVKRLAKNYSRKMVEPLKRFSSKIEGFEKEISWSYARFSVNHYLMINDLANRDQIAEMLAHSANTSKGYFDDVENQKFNIQQKLSDSFDEKNKKIPLGDLTLNSEKKRRK